MYIRTLRKELHKLKKEENKWKEVKVIQLKIQGERKKKSIKKIGKARKSFLESRVQRIRGWRANFRQKYWLCSWKKPVTDLSFNSRNQPRSSTRFTAISLERTRGNLC